MTDKYALFIFNPLMNSVTYATTHRSKEALMIWANEKFHDNLMFSIYKFRDHCHLFTQQVPATRWDLDTKFAGKGLHPSACHSTPMECAYQIDDGHEWFFKTF